MDSLKDLGGLFAVMVINIAGWAAGLTALLGVLPIPHTAHDWGLTIGSAVLFILGRIRDRRTVRRRLGALRSAVHPVVPPVEAVTVSRAARRAHDKYLGVSTHSVNVRKSARP